MKTCKLSLVIALVLLPISAFAAVPWTGNPGAASIDEGSTSLAAVDNSSLNFNSSGGTGTIVARLNLTDTTATGSPGWTNMQIWGYDPSPNSEIRVKLIRVSSGGTVTTMNTCSTSDSAMVQQVTCAIGSVDFTSAYTYAISIELSRTSNTVSPFIYGVRLY